MTSAAISPAPLVNEDDVTHEECNYGLLDVLLRKTSDYLNPEENRLSDKDWKSVIAILENTEVTEQEMYAAVMTKQRDQFEDNALILACQLHPPLKVIQLLVKFGKVGREDALTAVAAKDDQTAFHCACWGDAS